MNPSEWTAPDLGVLLRYGSALAIGLLMGLERERTPSARAGLRTFALVALFGVMTAQLSELTSAPWIIAIGLLLVGSMIIAAYFRQPDKQGDPGTTTVGAMLVCYGLGVLCWFGEIRLAVMLGIASTVLLYFKTELRGITQRLTRRDLISVLQFAMLSLIILPLLPNQGYGPYGALNPHQIWWMVLLISGLSLAGYAAFRIAGQRRGTFLIGLLGGLVSSTATTLAFSRHSKQNEAIANVAIIVILLANLVVLIRLAVEIGILSTTLLLKVAPILTAGLATGVLAAWYGLHKLRPGGEAPKLELSNPTEIPTALTFGALYAAVLLASAWVTNFAGPRGLYAVASLAGLTDVDAITLSTLRLFNLGTVEMREAISVIIIAFISNLIFKSALVWAIAGWKVARHAIAGMGAIAVGLCVSWALS